MVLQEAKDKIYMTKSETQKPVSIAPGCCSAGNPIVNLSSETIALRPRPWIKDKMTTSIGEVPVVHTHLSFSDIIGIWKARWGFGRMHFRIEPGLYAVGQPTENSPVFVSANYKMSFDRLRSQLGRIDGWILVLDTKGINVWCAAGKGTFGTEELIARIKITGLDKLVSHRRIILPQLGAPGVSAHEVKDRSDFRVIYGPVRAADIAAFIQGGMKAAPEMRRVRFNFRDRLVLTPNDLIANLRYFLPAAVVLFLLAGLGPDFFSADRLIKDGMTNLILILTAYISGTLLPILLLPWLPGKSFSAKGAWCGLITVALLGWFLVKNPSHMPDLPSLVAWFIIFPTVGSFISMNFTGSSTYTSLSGVVKEMQVALPLQIGASVIALILLIVGIFV